MRELSEIKKEIFKRSRERTEKRRRLRKRIAVCTTACICICAVVLILPYSGAYSGVAAEDLMTSVVPNLIEVPDKLSESKGNAFRDFAVRLLAESVEDGENVLVSPLSMLNALAMTANGARGETLSQMEEVFGMSKDEMNLAMATYISSLNRKSGNELKLANSVWFKSRGLFEVNADFLQTNADYFGAAAYKAPFNNGTLKDINRLVEEQTDGMIKDVLDKIPKDAVMYLINALAFEADWFKPYEKDQVYDGIFNCADGKGRKVTFMKGSESRYLKDETAQGFVKYYKGESNAFVAMLPDEGVSVEEYAASLTGEKLAALLSSPERRSVTAVIPKFELEYEAEASVVLRAMGMVDVFDIGAADLGGMVSSGKDELYVSRVLHKTYISVAEKGTRAGAVTLEELFLKGMEPMESTEVILDRPFVYMIVDCENNVPFFIGCVNSIGE